jgi:hypothetical protein
MLEGREGDAARSTAEKLARALDVDPAWLMFGQGHGPAPRVKRAGAVTAEKSGYVVAKKTAARKAS